MSSQKITFIALLLIIGGLFVWRFWFAKKPAENLPINPAQTETTTPINNNAATADLSNKAVLDDHLNQAIQAIDDLE